MVLRDGTMRGGGGFYYSVGSYTCSDGKWKGEMTSQEHSPIAGTNPWARKVTSLVHKSAVLNFSGPALRMLQEVMNLHLLPRHGYVTYGALFIASEVDNLSL